MMMVMVMMMIIIMIIIIIIIIITTVMDGKNKGDTSNDRGDWNHFKIIQKIVSSIPGNHEVRELQKTAILGTAHIFRKVLT